MSHSTLADRLQQLRAERATERGRPLSQEEVADAVGVSRSYLAGCENGHDKPGYESFVALADYYGVSLDWLAKVGSARAAFAAGPRASKVARLLDLLPETEQDFFLAGCEFRAQQLGIDIDAESLDQPAEPQPKLERSLQTRANVGNASAKERGPSARRRRAAGG